MARARAARGGSPRGSARLARSWAWLALALLAGSCRQVLGIDELSSEDLAAAAAGAGGATCAPCEEPAPPAQGACSPGCLEGGVCVGRVVPAFERCATADVDESCDGRAACTGDHLVSVPIGGSGEQGFVLLGADAAGDVLAAGPITGSLVWGAQTLPVDGYSDVFVGKISAAGERLWVKQLGDSDEQAVSALAVIDGDPVIAGRFYGTFPGTDLSTGPSTESGYVIRLDGATGDIVWTKQLSSDTLVTLTTITATPDGDVVLCGQYAGALPLGGAAGTLPAPADIDLFVVRLDGAQGTATWGKSFPSTGSPVCTAAAAAPGTVWVGGVFTGGDLTFGGTLLHSINGFPLHDGFLARLDDQGEPVWAAAFVADGDQYVTAIELDPDSGRGYVLGDFYGATTFAGQGSTSMNDSRDLLVAAIEANGSPAWLQTFGDSSVQLGFDLARDAEGNLLLTGFFDGAIDFGGGVSAESSGGEDPSESTSVEDGFVAKLRPDGTALWAHAFGTPGAHEDGTAVTTAPLGDVFVGGSFEDQLQFPGGDTLVCGAGCVSDIFVTKLAP